MAGKRSPQAIDEAGRVGAVIRERMEALGLTPRAVNEYLGREAGHAGIYQWRNGAGAPGMKGAGAAGRLVPGSLPAG